MPVGAAEAFSYPGLSSPQAKLKHKLTIMYSQINGASRALEDVRARQQDVRVSDRAVHHQPRSWGLPQPPGSTGSVLTSTKLTLGSFTALEINVSLVRHARSYMPPERSFIGPNQRLPTTLTLRESLKIRVEK